MEEQTLKRRTYRLEDSDIEKLQEIADTHKKNMSEMLRFLIRKEWLRQRAVLNGEASVANTP